MDTTLGSAEVKVIERPHLGRYVLVNRGWAQNKGTRSLQSTLWSVLLDTPCPTVLLALLSTHTAIPS